MNPESSEENAGGMAERTRSRTQHLSDEEERTERLRTLSMSEVLPMVDREASRGVGQEASGGVGPGAMLAHREPLNAIPTTLEMIQTTQPRVLSLESTPLQPDIRAIINDV